MKELRNLLFPLICLFLTYHLPSFAQLKKTDDDKNQKQGIFDNWPERIYYGGNVGFQFGSSTFIDLSPLVGYRVTQNFACGVGASYRYMRFSTQRTVFENRIVGGRIFARYAVYQNLFTHAEYEILNSNWYFTGKNFNVETLMGGLGYAQPIGSRSSFMIMGLWTIYSSPIQIYQNPIVRMGFSVGL